MGFYLKGVMKHVLGWINWYPIQVRSCDPCLKCHYIITGSYVDFNELACRRFLITQSFCTITRENYIKAEL